MAGSKTKKATIKILSVVWYKVLPAHYGGQKAVAHFNEHLGELTPLTMLCSRNNSLQNGSYLVRPELPVTKTQFINPFIWWKIYQVAKQENITHLILEFPYHGIAGWICKRLLKIRLIVNTHNIESIRFKEQKKWWWHLLYFYEGWLVRRADVVFFKTNADKERAQKLYRLSDEKLAVIPYGALKVNTLREHIDIRGEQNIPENCRLFLFAGTLDYQPNADAVVAIFKNIAPLLDATGIDYRILIIGRNHYPAFHYLQHLSHPNIRLLGEVEEADAYYAAANVLINPVLTGGGIQTKLMDAIAQGLNVVCFASKAVSINAAGQRLFAVEEANWNEFVAETLRASSVVVPTPPAFYKRYDWRTIAATAVKAMQTNA